MHMQLHISMTFQYRPLKNTLCTIRNGFSPRYILYSPMLNICSPLRNIRSASRNIHSAMVNINVTAPITPQNGLQSIFPLAYIHNTAISEWADNSYARLHTDPENEKEIYWLTIKKHLFSSFTTFIFHILFVFSHLMSINT